jgi:hypothetical protein
MGMTGIVLSSLGVSLVVFPLIGWTVLYVQDLLMWWTGSGYAESNPVFLSEGYWIAYGIGAGISVATAVMVSLAIFLPVIFWLAVAVFGLWVITKAINRWVLKS